MTKHNYETFAIIIGQTLATATENGGDDCRTAIYESLYVSAVNYFASCNPRFDHLKFSHAVGCAESRFLRILRQDIPCEHCGGIQGYHACDAAERGEV